MGRKNKNKLQLVVKRKHGVPSTPPAPSPPWIELPGDFTANILGRLGAIEILASAQKVCTTWRNVCRDYPPMWRVIHMAKPRPIRKKDQAIKKSGDDLTRRDLQIMCRLAVDRSQGLLIDIYIEGFCTDDLLRYISQRCSQLQRLRVAFCDGISGEVLSEAVKKFPLLNELYLFSIRSSFTLDDIDIEAIGRSCPMLKSFTFTDRVDEYGLEPYDGDALAVAETMRGLRHLRLFGNCMTESGLEAILDRCSHLESLDIRLCFNADDLTGDLIERCRRQIRQVRLPKDPCSDHEFIDRIQVFISWVDGLRESGYYSPDYGWYIQR